MATRVMPSLLPQTVNPGLTLEHFSNLLEVLQEMLNQIERYAEISHNKLINKIHYKSQLSFYKHTSENALWIFAYNSVLPSKDFVSLNLKYIHILLQEY